MLSMTDGKAVKTRSTDEVKSSCKYVCWGDFENCVKIDETKTGHLICLEARDGCTDEC